MQIIIGNVGAKTFGGSASAVCTNLRQKMTGKLRSPAINNNNQIDHRAVTICMVMMMSISSIFCSCFIRAKNVCFSFVLTPSGTQYTNIMIFILADYFLPLFRFIYGNEMVETIPTASTRVGSFNYMERSIIYVPFGYFHLHMKIVLSSYSGLWMGPWLILSFYKLFWPLR